MTEAKQQVDIETAVRQIIAESLDLDLDEVHRDAKVWADLGADSLDALDISYRVDREFGFNLPLLDLKRHLEESEVQWLDDNGGFTEEGLQEVLHVLPEFQALAPKAGEALEGIVMRLTVGDLVDMVTRVADRPPRMPNGDSRAQP
jgi:acyl carrier protein